MKEVTYKDWMENPTPRMMWVWDGNEKNMKQRKVIHYFMAGQDTFPVTALSEDERSIESFGHCAEIEEPKTRRMTYKELSRWLREKPTREYTYSYKEYIGNWCGYTIDNQDNQDNEVTKDIFIREDDGEWKEPLVEVTDD